MTDVRVFEHVADALIRVGADAAVKRAVLGTLMDHFGVPMMSAEKYRTDPAIRVLFAERGVTLLPVADEECQCTLEPAPEPERWIAVCSCGKFRSQPLTILNARLAHGNHAAAALAEVEAAASPTAYGIRLQGCGAAQARALAESAPLLTPNGAAQLFRPCPDSGCEHTGACGEADRRRVDSGHPVSIVPRPKMDAQNLVAAVCGCGRYSSNPSSVFRALASWRQHADDTLAAPMYGIRPHLPRTAAEARAAREMLLALPPLTGEDAQRLMASLGEEGEPPTDPRSEPGSVK